MILAASMQWNRLAVADDVLRLKRRDPDALTLLINRYQHRLYRYLLRFVREPATAQDLFQQTWLRVVETIGRFDAARSFEAWLFALAHNLAIDHLRRKRTESLDEPAAEVEAAASGLDALERAIASERAQILVSAVSELPAVYREVLALRFEEDMKLEEIAHVVGAPLPTVKTRLRRALIGLREVLARRLGEGGSI